VLGNGADAYHESHVHIDLMERTNNYKIVSGCAGSHQTAVLLATPHEIQRPKTCERFGSARPLKTGSQPIGGCDSVVTTVDETVEVCLGATCKRSPLWLRSPVAAESPATARPPMRRRSPAHKQRNKVSAVVFICDTLKRGSSARLVANTACVHTFAPLELSIQNSRSHLADTLRSWQLRRMVTANADLYAPRLGGDPF
jgi:hypothetical protein